MTLAELTDSILTIEFLAGLSTGALCSKAVRGTLSGYVRRKFGSKKDNAE